MKFCAPTANWDMRSDSSWWTQLGGAQSTAGVRVSQETALTYSAVFACTRVISETLASLPLNLMEHVDQKTTRKATEHALYPLLHDTPNPEMDIVAWLDMQVALQLNWGNAYAEIQRDSTGEIKALWPIHASRIPLYNIYRNARNPSGWKHIEAGQPGELVYLVNNDDGSRTPLPASDMLHVPGVLSKNGITGLSIPLTGAESIGIALATDKHAGAYFRNGAVSNMAIKSPKLVKKETAEYLREQWQKTFGGVQNHYKTLLLEDGMEPVQFSIAPEASQLIESRQLGAREIARLYRVPPHMIGDLSRATWANIESEEIAFVTHTMLPWITRWEKAIYRQLLTDAERKKYRAKFNVMGLLRGDSAARSQFYQVLFNLGALSPNDVREFEDMNPIDGGDQYFVPANNLVPLDKIGELAQVQIDKLNEPAPQPVAPAPDEGDEDEEVEDRRLSEIVALIENRDTLDVERHAESLAAIASDGDRVLKSLIEHVSREFADVKQAWKRDVQHLVEASTQASAAISARIEAVATSREELLSLREEELRVAIRESVKATMVGMAAYEGRFLKAAAETPETFVKWRSGFYQDLRRKLAAVLQPFEAPACRLKCDFDADVVAARHCDASIMALEPLLDVPCDQFSAIIDLIVSAWHERPDNTANEIIPQRLNQCAA